VLASSKHMLAMAFSTSRPIIYTFIFIFVFVLALQTSGSSSSSRSPSPLRIRRTLLVLVPNVPCSCDLCEDIVKNNDRSTFTTLTTTLTITMGLSIHVGLFRFVVPRCLCSCCRRRCDRSKARIGTNYIHGGSDRNPEAVGTAVRCI